MIGHWPAASLATLLCHIRDNKFLSCNQCDLKCLLTATLKTNTRVLTDKQILETVDISLVDFICDATLSPKCSQCNATYVVTWYHLLMVKFVIKAIAIAIAIKVKKERKIFADLLSATLHCTMAQAMEIEG